MPEKYDAIVVGAGPSGAVSAALLAQAGWRVGVIEKAPFPRKKVCGEFISATTWPLLSQLGVSSPLLKLAGPTVRRVGVYAGSTTVAAELVSTAALALGAGGRAVGREHLDTLLLERATIAGATIWQPCALVRFVEQDGGYDCTFVNRVTGETRVLQAQLIVAAHGSWESGPLPTQNLRRLPGPADLFGFKARFMGGTLPHDLMPLLAFPGGYGGMVHTDADRISLSCCIRRDELERCRRRAPASRAGEAVMMHLVSACKGASAALAGAVLDGAWLSSGPLRPGIRSFGRNGLFAVGNAAAETHPIVAEGISIAVQSAALLCEQLIARPEVIRGGAAAAGALKSARAHYAAAWRANFATRLYAAAIFAKVFSRSASTRTATTLLERFPQLLTEGARWSGKTRMLSGMKASDGSPS